MNPLRRRIHTAMQTRGGAAAWTPASIAGLSLWYDATQIAGLVNNDPVATWTDASVNANNATQGTVSARPTYKTNVQNSKPAVLFDGVDDVLAIGTPLTSATYTIFIVQQTSGDGCLLGNGSAGGNTQFRIGYPASNKLQWYSVNSGSGGANNPAESSALATARTSFSAVAFASTGTTVNFYENNTARGGGGNSIAGTGDGIGSVGGIRAQGTPVVLLTGYIAEVIIYNSALSAGDRTLVFDYLAAKWAY